MSRTWNVEKKEYILLGSHDIVLQSKSPADPAASASETEPHLVSKSNMHEWHKSSQVLIVQPRGKLWKEDQNLPQARIDRLPQGRPHVGQYQYQYRPVIPRMVYAHYPNYKEHSRAVKQMRIWFSWHERLSAYLDLVCDVRSHQPQRNIIFRVNIRCSATHIDRTNQSNLW